MFNFINSSNFQGSVSTTVPELSKSIPSKLQGGREWFVVVAFRNTTLLLQKVTIAALNALIDINNTIVRFISRVFHKPGPDQLLPPSSHPNVIEQSVNNPPAKSTTDSISSSSSSSFRLEQLSDKTTTMPARQELAEFTPIFELEVRNQADAKALVQFIQENPWFKGRVAKIIDDTHVFELGYTPKEILSMGPLYHHFNDSIEKCLYPKRYNKAVFDYCSSNRYYSENGAYASLCKCPLTEELADVRVREAKDTGKLVIPECEISEEQVIESMLAQFDGICLADTRHEMSEPKQFLIERMSYLKELGVTTIFMEHLFYETQQKTLDDYILNQDQDAKMPPDLEAYLNYLDNVFLQFAKPGACKPGFKAIVEKAKKEGVRIVAIDTGPSYAIGSNDDCGHDNYSKRGPALNHQTYAIVKREMKKDEKYVVFCGGAHVIERKGVPGISQFLQIPNIFIEKSKSGSTSIQANLEKHPKAEYQLTGLVHALIHRP